MTPQTTNIAINVDGMIPAISRAEIEEAAEELKQLLLRYCGGTISVHYLNASNRKMDIQL